jgi:hypothetical protein
MCDFLHRGIVRTAPARDGRALELSLEDRELVGSLSR